MSETTMRETTVETVHVAITCGRSFEAARDALVASVAKIEPRLMTLLVGADSTGIAERRATGPKLWLFETRDHGALVAAEGHPKKALQFEIGNPLTAERMTRRRPAAGLYAPLRVVLYETEQGRAVFEYDLPSSLFDQFDDLDVSEVGRELDGELKQILMAAAG